MCSDDTTGREDSRGQHSENCVSVNQFFVYSVLFTSCICTWIRQISCPQLDHSTKSAIPCPNYPVLWERVTSAHGWLYVSISTQKWKNIRRHRDQFAENITSSRSGCRGHHVIPPFCFSTETTTSARCLLWRQTSADHEERRQLLRQRCVLEAGITRKL